MEREEKRERKENWVVSQILKITCKINFEILCVSVCWGGERERGDETDSKIENMTGSQRYTGPKRKTEVKVRAMNTKDVQTQQVCKC